MAKSRKALDEDAAVASYRSGESIRAIAANVGWSYSGLHGRLVRALARTGEVLRPRGGKPVRRTTGGANG